jgi:hypothetical protein
MPRHVRSTGPASSSEAVRHSQWRSAPSSRRWSTARRIDLDAPRWGLAAKTKGGEMTFDAEEAERPGAAV